jgi:aminopeptidase N
VAFYAVTVKAPKSLLVAATGQQVSNEAQGGTQTLSYEAGPARDFYIAASTKFQVITKQAGDVTLSFYFKDGHKPAAQNALNIAAEALDDFGKRYAPYPYTELDFVETPTYALGIEYPGIIAITDQIMNADDNYLEGTVAHEVGHQWFYNLVGNDQLDDPWLDESLTQFATMEYFSDEYGQRGYDIYHSELVDNWAYIGSENIAVGKPVADYTEAEYVAIVYGRGGLFFEALRSEMGAETFDAFLKEYTEAMTWKISTPDILKEYAEKHCNCDLTPLFDEWIW